MNLKYKITETSIVDRGLSIEFECWAKDIDTLKSSITIESAASMDNVSKYVNDAAYNILTPIISAKEHAEKRKNDKSIKKDKCELLKIAIDEEKGKEKPVKKPEKK